MTATTTEFTLWHRTGRRAKWEAIGTAPSYQGAHALSYGTGRKGGDWLVMPAGTDPNETTTRRHEGSPRWPT